MALLLACGPDAGWDTPDGSAFDDGKADGFAGTYRGVAFTVDEANATLALVNGASRDVLDQEAGVGSRAATTLVDARPLYTVAALSNVSQVGPSALIKLRQFAVRWVRTSNSGVQCGLGGKFDGITFTPTQECRALDIVNTAGYLQLGQLDSTPRRSLYDRRPWRSLRDVAESYGVGAEVMRTLAAMSGEWVTGMSGHADTVGFILLSRPSLINGRGPQVTIDRAFVTGRVAGTPCLWLTDAQAGGDNGARIQLCAPGEFTGTEALFRSVVEARASVMVRASYKLRSNGVPYLLAFANDFIRVNSERLR